MVTPKHQQHICSSSLLCRHGNVYTHNLNPSNVCAAPCVCYVCVCACLLCLQVLTWLVLPFFQVYADAGDFTVGGRCVTSLKENGLLYGLAGAAGVFAGGSHGS